MSTPADASTAALGAVAEARYRAHYEPTRTWGFVAGMGTLCAGLVGLCLVPEVRRFLGVAPSAMALLMGLMFGATTTATLAAKRGGVLDPLHRRLERLETLVCAIVGAALLFLAGNAASIFWIVPVVNVVLAGPDVLGARFLRWAHALCLGSAALAYALRDQRGDALIILFVTGVLLLVSSMLEQSTRAAFALEVERDRLRLEVERLGLLNERQRIARDLHDGVGAELAALAWAADALLLSPSSSEEELKALSARARLGLRELRSAVQGLKTEDLSLVAFAASLRQSCGRGLPPGVTLSLAADGDLVLPRAIAAELGLMVREAVRNAVSHGHATQIDVSLVHGAGLRITLTDDGEGLPPDIEYRSDGGLAHLQTRAELLGASIAFERPARGTRIVVEVPASRLISAA